jgi:hypothetical protein
MVLSLPFSMKKSVKRTSSALLQPRRHSSNNNSIICCDPVKDDDSTSSTVLTHPTDKQRQPLQATTSETVRKSVRFCEEDNEMYDNQVMTKTQVKDLWYGPLDYRFFRSMALDASQHITATEKRNRAPYSYQRVLERAHAVCSAVIVEPTSSLPTAHHQNATHVLDATDFLHLQRWLEVATSRLGLEKWSIRSIAADKVTRRHALTEAVLGPLYQHDAHALRAECERLSRPSRLFSHTLALGLAAALEKEQAAACTEIATTAVIDDDDAA